jgi:hypothetical protein
MKSDRAKAELLVLRIRMSADEISKAEMLLELEVELLKEQES